MSDIVERLRKRSDQYPVDALFTEAASEIERLRSELDNMNNVHRSMATDVANLGRENAKLRTALLHAKGVCVDYNHHPMIKFIEGIIDRALAEQDEHQRK